VEGKKVSEGGARQDQRKSVNKIGELTGPVGTWRDLNGRCSHEEAKHYSSGVKELGGRTKSRKKKTARRNASVRSGQDEDARKAN